MVTIRRHYNAACAPLRTACILLPLFLIACQSSTPGEILAVNPAANTANPASGPAPASGGAVFGTGPVRMAIVASAETAASGRLADVRNGAKLAIEDLGGGELTVEILQAAAGETAMNEKAVEAYVKGAAVIGYAGNAPAASAGSVLQLALVPNGATRPQGSLAFISSAADSLEWALAQTGSAGATSITVLTGPTQRASAAAAVANLKVKTAVPVALVEYGTGETATSVAAKVAVAPGTVVGFAGNGPEIAAIAAALSAKAAQAGAIQFIGNSGWAGTSLPAAPALEGALVAMPDTSNEKIVSDRYRKSFGIVPSLTALQVYDAVAIVAGINRAKGLEGFKDGTIMSPSGFKGATGAFRFRRDGSVERAFALEKVAGNKLVAVTGSPSGF
jgi:hypothetical protein